MEQVRVRQFLLFIVGILFSLQSFANPLISHETGFPQVFGKYRYTLEEISLPDDEKMGLLGGNYLIGGDRDVYLGLGIYGAVTGERGGFFVGGLGFGSNSCWSPSWCMDYGLFVGGGGGGAAPQGGGLMLRPHLELKHLYSDTWNWGVGASRVAFPNGDIESDQISFSIERNFSSIFLPGWHSEDTLQGFFARGRGLATVNRFFSVQSTTYYPSSGQNSRSSLAHDEPIHLIGIRWRQGTGKDPYWWEFETAGAWGGQADGLAQVFGGLSYQICKNEKIACHAGILAGSAGGGDVHTGGGILGRILVGASYHISRHWALLTEVGQTSALQAPFNAFTANVALGYEYGAFITGHGVPVLQGSKADFWTRARVRSGVQGYIAPVSSLRKSGAAGGENIEMISLKLDAFLSKSSYVTGQAYGAFAGRAGGYAVGLMGAGYKKSISQLPMYIEGEFAAGAGGGGGIASGSGVLLQPMFGVGFDINRQLAFGVSLGHVYAPSGDLDATVVDLSLNYKFSAPRLN